MLLIIGVVYIADEVCSQIGGQMQSILAQYIFAPIFGAEVAVGRMSLIGTVISVAGMGLSFIYKPLSDRYGRKIFLVINTFGMGLGLFLVGCATNIPVYCLGAFAIAFFIPNDIQAVYILESAPPKHRGKIFSAIKAMATLGMMLVPVFRKTFMGETTDKWRFVYLACAAFATLGAAFALIFVRESDAFVDKRLSYLTMTEEERAVRKAAEKEKMAQGGFFAAMKYIFKNKQLRWLTIGLGFLNFGQTLNFFYETTMTNGYAARFLEEGMDLTAAKLSAAPFITKALFLFPIGSALFQFAQGFLADKWGRKPTTIIMCASSVICYVLFFIGSRQAWNPYFVGFVTGAFIGSFWAALDVMGAVMVSESSPTNLRSSIISAQSILAAGILVFGPGIALVLVNILGDAYAGIISLCVAIPGMIVALAILLKKIRETKATDLTTL